MDEDMNSRTQGLPAEHCIVMRRPMFHLLVLSLLWLITFVFQTVSWVLFHSISSRFIVFNSNTQIGSTCKWDGKNWNWIISPAQNYHTGCVCDWGVISRVKSCHTPPAEAAWGYTVIFVTECVMAALPTISMWEFWTYRCITHWVMSRLKLSQVLA